MKILLVSVRSQKSKGGIAVWTECFIKKCEKSDVEYSLVNTEAIGKRQTKGSAKRNFFDELIRTKRIFSDLKIALKEHYDVAHINTSCGTFGLIRDYFITKKIKKKKIKTVVHFHCDIPFWVKNKISKYYLSKLLDNSDVNMVLCDSSAEFLNKEFGATSIKIPNFVDEALITCDEKDISKNIRKVCFVGSVAKSKGIFEIFALAERFPYIVFSILGVVSEEVAQINKPQNILLKGAFEHNEIINQLDDADLFLFPSHSEGFSMALAESMARGVPAIATDVGANRDMIEDCGGIIVNVGDIDGLADALVKMENKAMREKVSQNFIKKVMENYTTDIVFEQILRIY